MIKSEMLEPTAVYLIGNWHKKCVDAKTDYEKRNAWILFWHGLKGLQAISTASPEAIHFCMAVQTNMRMVRDLILHELKVDCETHPLFNG